MKKIVLASAIIATTWLGVASQALAMSGPIKYGGTTPVLAVPEPATWAMMLIGFGALGLVTRLRRRKALAA